MSSRTITVFYDGSHYIFRWLKALFSAHNEFKQRGFKIEYADFHEYCMHKFDSEKLKKKLQRKKYDIIFLHITMIQNCLINRMKSWLTF